MNAVKTTEPSGIQLGTKCNGAETTDCSLRVVTNEGRIQCTLVLSITCQLGEV